MAVCFISRRLVNRAAFLFVAITISALAQTGDYLAEQSRKAKSLMADGKFEEAIPIYKELVRAVPNNPGLILNLGLAEEMAGHPNEAIPNFEAVLKIQPANIPALTSLGVSHLQLNQPKQAVRPLQELVSLQPDNRDARGMLAGALLAIDRFSEAAEQYRKLAELNGNDAKAWYGLGKAYENLAANAFDRLEKIAPESAYVLALVGDSQASRQQYRSAFFFYRQAETKKADLLGLHTAIGEVYTKTGHSDWAAEEEARERHISKQQCSSPSPGCSFLSGKLLELTRMSAQTPDNLFWAAKAYNQLALGAFEKLGALPESAEIHALKADILRGHRQYAEAVKEWRAALRLAPGDEAARHELIVSLFLARDYDSLRPMLQEEIDQRQASAQTYFMLGDSYVRSQQPDKAIPLLEKAVAENPGMKEARASLGLALATVNRTDEAIPQLENAISLDEDGSLHYQLARAYQSKGNAQRARELMAQYQTIQSRNLQHKEEVARDAQITAPGQL